MTTIKNQVTNREKSIEWVSDDNYIEVGEKVEMKKSSLPKRQQSINVFLRPLNKSPYRLPISPNITHLVRISFYNDNYSVESVSPPFNFPLKVSKCCL